MARPSARAVALLCLLVVSGGLTACGGDDDKKADTTTTTTVATPDGAPATTAAPGNPSTPCALVTAAQLESAFGTPFELGAPTTAEPPTAFHVCEFESAATEDTAARTLTVRTLVDGDIDDEVGKTAEQLFEEQRSETGDPTPIDGLGDDAYSTETGVAFVQQGVYVTVDSPGAISSESSIALRIVAERVSAAL